MMLFNSLDPDDLSDTVEWGDWVATWMPLQAFVVQQCTTTKTQGYNVLFWEAVVAEYGIFPFLYRVIVQ